MKLTDRRSNRWGIQRALALGYRGNAIVQHRRVVTNYSTTTHTSDT